METIIPEIPETEQLPNREVRQNLVQQQLNREQRQAPQQANRQVQTHRKKHQKQVKEMPFL